MKIHISINQDMAIKLGITNANQAHIFDLLTAASSWATPVSIEGEVYYWVARQTVVKELPLLGLKPDTVYRHLKTLSDLGLIVYKKQGTRDCVRLTDKGKTYMSNTYAEGQPKQSKKGPQNSDSNPSKPPNEVAGEPPKSDKCDLKLHYSPISDSNPSSYFGNRSESAQNSDLDPNKLGFESGSNSDSFPTYPFTIKRDPFTRDQERSTVTQITQSFQNAFSHFFNLYPKHRRKMNLSQAWSLWVGQGLTAHDLTSATGWVAEAGEGDPKSWAADANGYAYGLAKFIRGAIWKNEQPPAANIAKAKRAGVTRNVLDIHNTNW